MSCATRALWWRMLRYSVRLRRRLLVCVMKRTAEGEEIESGCVSICRVYSNRLLSRVVSPSFSQ